MRTTATHVHSDGTVCWYENDPVIEGWWTQLPEDYVDPDYPEGGAFARQPTQNVRCPQPGEKAMTETGDRTEVLVGGDAPQ